MQTSLGKLSRNCSDLCCHKICTLCSCDVRVWLIPYCSDTLEARQLAAKTLGTRRRRAGVRRCASLKAHKRAVAARPYAVVQIVLLVYERKPCFGHDVMAYDYGIV